MSAEEVLARKRQARREKILNNSKNRLERIANPDSKSKLDNKKIDTFEEVEEIKEIKEESKNIEKIYETSQENTRFDETPQIIDENHDTINNLQFSPQLSNDDRLFKEKEEIEPKNNFANFLVFVILGLFTRIVFCTGFGNCVLKNIWVPFILFQIAKSNFFPGLQVEEKKGKGSFLSAALVLSGLKNEWIQKFTSYINRMAVYTRDFLLYLFSFCMAHIFLQSFVKDGLS